MKCFSAPGKFLTVLVVLGASLTASAAEIVFPFQRRWDVNGYLTYFMSKVPLTQIRPSAGDVMVISGPLVLNFERLPEPVAELVQGELAKALRGERLVAGARFDASAAQVQVKALPAEPIVVSTPIEREPELQMGDRPLPEPLPLPDPFNPYDHQAFCGFVLMHVPK